MSSDVTVKQEHSGTDSTEKNPSTTQPTPAKPAQEQTRTENLQRIQQRKLKVKFCFHTSIAIRHKL